MGRQQSNYFTAFSKMNEFVAYGRKRFPFSAEPFSDGICFQESNRMSQELSAFQKWRKQCGNYNPDMIHRQDKPTEKSPQWLHLKTSLSHIYV